MTIEVDAQRQARLSHQWDEPIKSSVILPAGPTASQTPTNNGSEKELITPRSYLDRITVAGLHNYLYAIERYEKITWYIGFLMAFAGTLFYLVSAIRQYLEFTIVLDIQQQTAPTVRLQNPWICRYAISISHVRAQFDEVKSILEADSRIRLILERYNKHWRWPNNVTIDDLFRHATWFVADTPINPGFDMYPVEQTQPQFVVELIAKSIEAQASNWRGIKSLYEEGFLNCPQVMRNCTLNGIAFDCCADNYFGFTQAASKCFKIDIRREMTKRGLYEYAQRTDPVELSFETFVDGSIFDQPDKPDGEPDVEATGIDISFHNRMDTLFDFGQSLAAGTVSTIRVQATRKRKVTNCMQRFEYDQRLHEKSHPIIQNYFKEMSGPDNYYVEACGMGKLIEAMSHQCGCVPYFDTMRPQNDSDICTPAHLYACFRKAFQNTLPTEGGSAEAVESAKMEDDMKRDIFHNIKRSMASECSSLCDSWTYDFSSTSMIADGPEGDVSRFHRNKVTIIFDPEYRVETELLKTDIHSFIFSVGYSLGLILGISSITLIQIPVWSMAAVVLRRKLRKVSPLQRRGAVNAKYMH